MLYTGCMAYMTQEKKRSLAEDIKKVMPKGWKYSLGVRHHSTLVLTISSAPIDLIAENLKVKKHGDRPDYTSLNQHWLKDEYPEPLLSIFTALHAAMNVGNHDNSDIQSDYFDVGWYTTLQLGAYDRPFKVMA